jgi:hypothetical protein
MLLAEHDGFRRCLAHPACAEVLPWVLIALVSIGLMFALSLQLAAWATGPRRHYRTQCCGNCDAVRPVSARARAGVLWLTLLVRSALRGGPVPFICACPRCSGWSRR